MSLVGPEILVPEVNPVIIERSEVLGLMINPEVPVMSPEDMMTMAIGVVLPSILIMVPEIHQDILVMTPDILVMIPDILVMTPGILLVVLDISLLISQVKVQDQDAILEAEVLQGFPHKISAIIFKEDIR